MLVLMLNSGMRFVLPLLAPLLLDHGLSMSALGALFSGGNIAAGIAGTLAGGLLMKYLSPGRALFAAHGAQGIALLAVVMTLKIAPGPLLLPILRIDRCSICFAGLRVGLSLRHADGAFFAFAGRCRFYALSMY